MPTADLSVVSRSLKNLLEKNIERISGGGAPPVKVSIGYPEDLVGATRTINLHLYHVAEDQFCKNVTHPSGHGNIGTMPMSLSLFYLVTAHHADGIKRAEIEQEIMGRALKTLHDFALVRAGTMVEDLSGSLHEVLLSDIDDGTTTLEIILRPLTPEDALAYWASEQQQAVRLAAYYEVRLVQLEPEVPKTSIMPVLSVGQWVGPKPAVTLDASRSAIRFARPAALGTSLPEVIEVSPARCYLDLPPIDPAFTENNRMWLTGTGLSGGIRRRVVISHPAFVSVANPRGEVPIVAAQPPASPADARWGAIFGDRRVDLAIAPRLAPPTGPVLQLYPGEYTARVEVVIADLPSGTSTREVIRSSPDVTFQLVPRIRDCLPPVSFAGGGTRRRIEMRLSPAFNLTLNGDHQVSSIALAIDGVVYTRHANFTGGSAAGFDNGFRVLANSIIFQPGFNVSQAGLHIVRLTINGVDAQPFWLETGP